MWYSGTLTLYGVIIGVLVGMVLNQLPIAVAIATAAGVALDAWMRDRRVNQDER